MRRKNDVLWRAFRLSAQGRAREPIFVNRVAVTRVLQQQKIYLTPVQNRQVQAPGTSFLPCSDEVRPEGGHGNCCYFTTLTGVHEEPLSAVRNYGSTGKFGVEAYTSTYTEYPAGKIGT